MIDLKPNETFFFMLPLFLGVMAVFNRYLFKPSVALIEERSKQSDQLKAQALELGGETETLLAEYEAGVARARKTASLAREALLVTAHEVESQIIGRARAENEEKLADIRQTISGQRKEVEMELRQYAQELAKLMVKKVLEQDAA